MEIKIKKLYSDVQVPEYSTIGSVGLDICAYLKEEICLKSMHRMLINTGFCMEFSSELEVQIRSRSGLALKNGIIVLNSPGTIDSDYRGELKVILMNLGTEDFIIKPHMRIAQMVVNKYVKAKLKIVDNLSDSARDEGGFGSTGY